ncbi:MAG: 50S ribosomal protein L21 [Rhodobacteraceae bacterium]|nr:50S ribosomal protein L21 [Paracoccaceae bacterium]
MFAVIKTGGKQYRVQNGDVLRVEKLDGASGDKIQFSEVLVLGGDSPVIGNPLVEGAAVEAEVIDQIKADKVLTFHKRRRKHSSKRTRGHRQKLTLVRVTGILGAGGVAAAAAETVAAADPAPADAIATEAPAADDAGLVTTE